MVGKQDSKGWHICSCVYEIKLFNILKFIHIQSSTFLVFFSDSRAIDVYPFTWYHPLCGQEYRYTLLPEIVLFHCHLQDYFPSSGKFWCCYFTYFTRRCQWKIFRPISHMCRQQQLLNNHHLCENNYDSWVVKWNPLSVVKMWKYINVLRSVKCDISCLTNLF